MPRPGHGEPGHPDGPPLPPGKTRRAPSPQPGPPPPGSRVARAPPASCSSRQLLALRSRSASRRKLRAPSQAPRLICLADTYLHGHAPPGKGGWARAPRALPGKLEVRSARRGKSAAVAHFARRPGLHHSPKIGRQVWEAGSGAHRLGRPRAPRRRAPRAPYPLPRHPHDGPHPLRARRPVWARPRRADFSASPSVYRGRRCGSVL